MPEIANKTDHCNPEKNWAVYIIQTCDNLFYTGITTDIARRWKQHCGESGGARFFRGRKPSLLIYLEKDHDRSSASRREAAIKKLSRKAKERLLASEKNQLSQPESLS